MPSLSRDMARVYKLETKVFMMVCESIDSPRALTCWLMAKYEAWDEYLSLPDPDTLSPRFDDDYLVSQMMSKNPLLPTSHNRRAKALEKWFAAEDGCRLTNERFRTYEEGNFSFTSKYESFFRRFQRCVFRILGTLSRDDLEFAESNFRFGPGATASVSGSDVLPSRKITADWTVTPRLQPYLMSILPRFRGESAVRGYALQAFDKVTFVPKNAKTDRPISIGPHANIYVQLGIAELIRQRLRRIGVDLRKQKFINRQTVLRAQRDGLATIDLKSASDTVADRLIRMVLPPEWLALLDVARCDYSVVDGKEVKLEKYSAMGNGYTFELETLLFIAACQAAGSKDFNVFGDDIIVEQSIAPDLIDYLQFLGFEVNESKTCLAGMFFESCGVDVWYGRDVRPFFLKGKYESYHTALIRIANKLTVYAHKRYTYGRDKRFFKAWLYCASREHTVFETAVPLGMDNGLIRDFDEAAPARARRGFDAYLARTLSHKAVRSARSDAVGACLLAIQKGSPEGSRMVEYQRGSIGSLRKGTSLVQVWPHLGPWI